MTTQEMIQALKQMVADVRQLPDVKDESKEQAAEMLKNVISTLNVGRKVSSKLSFESPMARTLYHTQPDIDGSSNGMFRGLYLNINKTMPGKVASKNAGAIVEEGPDGTVTASFFPKIEDAYDAWEN